MKKRSWVHTHVDTSAKSELITGHISTCAICHCSLNGLCKNCLPPANPLLDERSRILLFTILLCFRGVFDMHIIWRIYEAVMKAEIQYVNGPCYQILLQCGHAYHSCCFDAWLKKRMRCPLCCKFNIDRILVESCVSKLSHVKFLRVEI